MSTLGQIKALRQEVSRLSSQHSETARLARDARNALLRARFWTLYFQFAMALRSPAKEYSLWIPGVLIIGVALVAAVDFVIFFFFGANWFEIAFVALFSGITTIGLFALVFLPANSELPLRIAKQKKLITQHQQELSVWEGEASKLRQRIYSAKSEINRLFKSEKLKRELLLRQNWKAMRGIEWEEYLVQVFEALGASANNENHW